MNALKTLKLGTRKSLLAWTQSSWVARELERLNPGLKVALVGIETQGDKILDKPLSQVDGKEFFTAELDQALLKGEVQLTVHSMKDLALDRPPAFTLAATPKRELPHDLIIFHETVLARLQAGLPIRIGTSSPRRLTLIPDFLKHALPQLHPQAPQLQWQQIRGNVNTRLSRIHASEDNERKLDAVVLAFAGLERLAQDESASRELWSLLKNSLLMVLPLRECPSAPAQGTLAIEALANNKEVLELIKVLHHERTLVEAKKERSILQEWGGGCHQKLGASLQGETLIIRGQKPTGEMISETRGEQATPLEGFTRVEAQDLFEFKPQKLSEMQASQLLQAKQVFVAHSRAIEHLNLTSFPLHQKTIWVSGTSSWFKLAKQGLWVQGSLDRNGFDSILSFLQKKLLRFENQPWAFLTHEESNPHPSEIALHPIPTYTHQAKPLPSFIFYSPKIYWTSSLPFLTVWRSLSNEHERQEFLKKSHACGAGKTANLLRKHGIEPIVFVEGPSPGVSDA